MEPTVSGGPEVFCITGTAVLDRWSRSGHQWPSAPIEKKLWVRQQLDNGPWYVSDTPDAPTTYPKPKYKALLAARFETAAVAIQAAKEWLMEKEAVARLGG